MLTPSTLQSEFPMRPSRPSDNLHLTPQACNGPSVQSVSSFAKSTPDKSDDRTNEVALYLSGLRVNRDLAHRSGGKFSWHRLATRRAVTKQFLAFSSEKTAGDGDAVIAFLEDEPTGDETSSPLVVLRAAFPAIGRNGFL